MNIQITDMDIPNGQKIKSIDFKIIFDESGETHITDILQNTQTQHPTQSPEKITISKQTISNNNDTRNILTSKDSEVIKPPEIDISKREAKIPEEMIGESF